MSTVPEKLADHEARLRELEAKHKETNAKVSDLVSFRSWLLGAAAVVGIVTGLFAQQLKTLLGIK